MAGEINFGLSDPNAFLRGAETMNKMMGNLAKKRAGKKLAEGDTKGGVNELYREGMIDEGQQVQHNETANAANAWGLDDNKRKANAQMASDVATALDNVRMQQGDGAVMPAFEQLLPVFRAQGIPEENIQKYREGLGQNPGAFIASMSKHANDYLQRYGFVRTPDGIYQTDKFTGHVDRKVNTPQYRAVPRDSSLVELGGDPADGDERTAEDLENDPNVISESGAYGGLAQPRQGHVMDEGQGRGMDPGIYIKGPPTNDPGINVQGPGVNDPGIYMRPSKVMSTDIPPGLSPEETAQYKEYLGQVAQLQAPQGAGGGLVAPGPSRPQPGAAPRAYGGARVIAEGRQTPRAAFQTLEPNDPRMKKYRPGTTVKVNTATGEETVVQGPAPASSATGAGGKPAKLAVQEQITLSKLRTEAKEARALGPLFDEFVSINKGHETGGLYSVPGAETVLKLTGDPNTIRMMSITSRVTPAMRNGLPGAASDNDVRMFQQATVGIDKPYAVNAQIAKMARAFSARQGDFLAFMEAWAKENNTLLGADEAWSQYADAEPLFEESKTGLPKVRKVTPWRQVIDVRAPTEEGLSGDTEYTFDPATGEIK